MPDNKKEQERDELHRAIWSIADDLRGSVDGWDFKSYVLGIMFYRYISENLTNYINDGEKAAGAGQSLNHSLSCTREFGLTMWLSTRNAIRRCTSRLFRI